MIAVINYADEKYRQAQIMCTATARMFGADQVWEYGPKSIPREFYEAHKFILDQPRGNGYWLWKPLSILDALKRVNDGDYVFYIDAGAAFIDRIQPLIDAMDQARTNVMVFVGRSIERAWTKRDAFLLMDCDSPEYTDTPQYGGGFVVVKKSDEARAFIEDWLRYTSDPRIVTDQPNELGQPNYPEFVENRHDQSVLGLLAKKKKLPPFRSPGTSPADANFSADVLERSTYPPVIALTHRLNWTMTPAEYLKLNSKRTTLPRGLECVCVLMTEGLNSEALSLLARLFNANDHSPLDWRQSWSELIEVLRLASESDDKIYGAMIKQIICRIILSMLDGSVPIDIIFVRELLTIAPLLKVEYTFEHQLKDRINRMLLSILNNRAQFGTSPSKGIKHFLDDTMRYLESVGLAKFQPA